MLHQRGVLGVAEFQDELHVDKKLCHTTGGYLVWLNFMLTKDYAAPEGGAWCSVIFCQYEILV